MPDKPYWYDRLEIVCKKIEDFPAPWIDRATLQSLLGVSTRRAQQILKPLVQQTIGKNGLASKESVLGYFRHLAAGDAAVFEHRRRERLHGLLNQWYTEARQRPEVLVEAPNTIVNQKLSHLPPGIHLSPGQILLDGFSTSEEAKQKLLALIMAIGNAPEEFDLLVSQF